MPLGEGRQRAEAGKGHGGMATQRTKLLQLVLAATVVLTGCATMRRSGVHDTEQLLAAAGFRIRFAASADAQPPDESMTPYRLVSRLTNGAVEYVYADPESCKCLYVGGPREYSEYQRLARERQIAQERLFVSNNAWVNWNYWGEPWRP